MKILFVTHTYGMGGANHSLLQLMKELKENYNVEPTLLVSKGVHPYPISEKCKEIGIECIVARYYWFKYEGYTPMNILRVLLDFLIFYPIVFWKLRGRKFDIIHSNGSVIDIGAYLHIIKKCPHVWHLREFGMEDFGLFSLLGKKYERWIYGKSNLFIAISNCIKDAYTDVIPEHKIRMIYNGIKLCDESLKSEHNNEIVQFVLVGVVQEAKNQLEAVKALKMVIDKGIKIHLNFIGIDQNEYADKVRMFLSQNNLEEYVTFWGPRNDVPQLLKKMDVGLMLSRNEAFGRVTVEYMMQNLAVIASDTGANPEIVDNGENGLIYRYGNVDDLKSQMLYYIDNKEKMLEIANKGMTHVRRNFTSANNSKNVYNTYRGVLSLFD